MEDKERDTSEIDEELSSQAKEYTDIGQFTIKLKEVIQITCSEICKPNTEVKGKPIPWWTESLKITRKRTNALRRRYRRRINNEELRETRKNQYTKAKKEYHAATKREKIRSWKQYCTATSPNNSWNEIYKLANNKPRSKQIIRTMRKPDGTKTETMTETLQLIMDQLIPEDKHKENTPYHRTIREQTKQPLYTMDEKEFTKEEVKQVVEILQPKKAPGPNAITNEIIKLFFKEIPKTITATHKAC